MPATSDLVGKTVAEADFRDRFGLTVIGLRRGAVATEGNLRDGTLKDRRHAAVDRPVEGDPRSAIG